MSRSRRLRSGRPDRSVLGYPKSRAFAELLIDREEDRPLRAVLVGMLRVGEEVVRSQAHKILEACNRA
jgi:hypothetical protein